jgi:hypothetical protein
VFLVFEFVLFLSLSTVVLEPTTYVQGTGVDTGAGETRGQSICSLSALISDRLPLLRAEQTQNKNKYEYGTLE